MTGNHSPFTKEMLITGALADAASTNQQSFENDETARKKLIATIEKLRSDMARDFELSFGHSEDMSQEQTMLKEGGGGSLRLVSTILQDGIP